MKPTTAIPRPFSPLPQQLIWREEFSQHLEQQLEYIHQFPNVLSWIYGILLADNIAYIYNLNLHLVDIIMTLCWGNWRMLHLQKLWNEILTSFIFHFDEEILFILPSFMTYNFLIEKMQMAAALLTIWRTKTILEKDNKRNTLTATISS